MGGSQSTRKLTVDNDNAIQVSQEALDRLQAHLSAQPARPPPASELEPVYLPPNPHYFESQKIQTDLAAEEAYWNRRIENLKKAHEKINVTMELEYKKALKEADELFNMAHNDKIASKLPPCQEEKAKVVQCYSSNPDKSLLCSVLVNQFNDCVCRSRISAVTAS